MAIPARNGATLILLAVILASSACSDSKGGSAPPPPPIDDVGPACPAQLSAVTTNFLTVEVGRAVEFGVQATDCEGQPAVGDVTFELVGDAAGSTLAGGSYRTDASGVAKNVLTAGPDEAVFQVRTSFEGAADLLINFTTVGDPMGSLAVHMTYAGSGHFDEFTAFLYVSSCSAQTEWTVEAALQSSEPVGDLGDVLSLPRVPEGSEYAVFVRADRGGVVAGYGCVDASVIDNTERSVTVALLDAPPIFNGVYDLDDHFDLSESPPASIGRVMSLVNEATDDNDLNNSDPANGQFGQDPSAFLLDFLYRQVCCWEATDVNPSWDTCTDQDFTHAYGDLTALYTEDFTQWPGAQPRVTGVCGGIWGANVLLQQFLQDAIVANMPEIASRLIDMVTDVTDTFEALSIKSTLTISDLSITKVGNFTHELISVHVKMHDLVGEVHEYDVALVDAGLTGVSYTGPTTAVGQSLVIPEHTLSLDLGMLMRHIYTQTILPQLGYTSTTEMLATFVDCAAVGVWVADQVGIMSADAYEGYCVEGLDKAAAQIEDTIDDLSDTPTTLTFVGTADGGEIDAANIAHTLVDGVWSVEWSEGPESGTFPGTFVGQRR